MEIKQAESLMYSIFLDVKSSLTTCIGFVFGFLFTISNSTLF